MIEKHEECYIPVCDLCGHELPAQPTWNDARRFLLNNGWKPKRDTDGSYIDICEDCQEESET